MKYLVQEYGSAEELPFSVTARLLRLDSVFLSKEKKQQFK